MVKNPPCNAEDVGSVPGQGTKIPHSTEKLNLFLRSTEAYAPHLLKPVHYNERVHIATTKDTA